MFKAIVPDPNDEGIILVRGVPFGSPQNRDVHGQYFTQNTNFLAHILPLPPVFHFHGAKSGSLADQIGETLSREQRHDGVWYRAKLYIDSVKDDVKQKAVQLWEAAKAGKLFASSGAVEATIKVAGTGEIVQWLVGELSLIDNRNNRENPANFHATVQPIKADLGEIEVGEVTIESLELPTSDPDSDEGDDLPNLDERIKLAMLKTYQQMLGRRSNPDNTRSAKMSDELLAQLQTQLAEMTAQMGTLQTQVTEQATQLQQRDTTINELQGIVSTKSAEVAMGTHGAMVDAWIKDGKIAPAEKDHVLEVLSFAYQADTTTKGDIGFVNAIKGWVEARPVNPVIGSPSAVYSNLNGGATEGPGGSVDPANIARLKRYAEIPTT